MCPLIGTRIQVGIDKHAVAGLSRLALQGQSDQVAESAAWQSVLTRKETVVRTKAEIGPVIHGFSEKQRPQPARQTRRYSLVEEQPNVSAVSRSRTFERSGDSPPGTDCEIGGCVLTPPLAVEIDHQKVTAFIEQHGIEAHRERLAVIVCARQVPTHHSVGDGEEPPVGAVGALDLRLFAHARSPLVGTCGRITRPTGCQALESARIDVLTPPKQRAKQGDLTFGAGAVTHNSDFVHGHYRVSNPILFAGTG